MALSNHKNGLKNKITASALLQPPLKMKHSIFKLRNLYFGIVNKLLGRRYNATFRQNLEYLQPIYKEKFNINL
jgi:hypothetical protein